MDRIVITMDDDGSIDITAKSEGGDVETMEATTIEEAVDIVREVMMETSDDDMEMDEPEDAMDDDMNDMMSPEEYERSWNEEAEKRKKDRDMQD